MAQRSDFPIGLPSQGPFGEVHPRARTSSDFRLKPTPTRETQELYDKMKQMERDLNLDQRIQLLDGSDNSQGYLLEPPTPSQATTMSRSSSVRSHTHSVTYSNGPVDIEELVDQEDRSGIQKRRAVRHGPLNKYQKARAALLRKLVACDICRGRKVRCNHHDLSEFEVKYQRTRQPQGAAQLRPPNPYPLPPSQPSTPSFCSSPQEFSHMGEHIRFGSMGHSSDPTVNGQDGPEAELERMLQDIAADPAPRAIGPCPAPLYNVGRQGELFSSISTFVTPGTLPAQTPGHLFMDNYDQFLPICRLVNGLWACQWSDGTDSSECDSEAEVCGELHLNLPSLSAHFRGKHAHFRDAEPPFYWICSQCRLKWAEEADVCPQPHCSSRRAFERWYFGNVASLPTRTTPSSIRLSGYGPTPAKTFGGDRGVVSNTGAYTISSTGSSGSMNRGVGGWGPINQHYDLARPVDCCNNSAKQLLGAGFHSLCAAPRSINKASLFELGRPLLGHSIIVYALCLAWVEGPISSLLALAWEAPFAALVSIRRYMLLYLCICISAALVGIWQSDYIKLHFEQKQVLTKSCPGRDISGLFDPIIEHGRVRGVGDAFGWK